MKKITTMFIMLCMLFTMLPMGTTVTATTVTSDANLVFDMDLSACTSANVKQVADKSGAGMIDSITYGYEIASGTTNHPPVYETVEETGTPCLTFANYNGTSNANGSRVLYANFKNDKISQRNIANSNAVTIETWAKLDADGQGAYSKMFSFGCRCQQSDLRTHAAFATQFNTAGSNNINFYADRGGATHNGNGSNGAFTISEDYAGKWAHYVFVREWLPSESAGTGNWQLTLYINGEKTVKTVAESAKMDYSVPFTVTNSHYPTTLMIGCDDGYGQARSLAGSIATFKLYDDARTETEVKTDYNSTKSDFYVIVPKVESVTFKNQSGEEIDNISVPIAEATKIEVMAKIKDCPEDVVGILALYNESGALVSATLAAESVPDADAVTSMRARLEGVSGIDRAAFYIWDATNKLHPLFTPKSIGGEPEPLKITGGFYGDAADQEISYAEGNENISAKLKLSAGEPPESLTAALKLMRAQESVYEASKTITFTDGLASAELAYEVNEAYSTLPTLQEDDELVVTVTDGTTVVFEKRLPYSDQSKIVDILLVAGQSNAEGQGGDANLTLKPEEDTVYYNTMGNTTLSTSGVRGWNSALGKTWYEETGRKVLIVKAAWGGTGFPNKLNIDTGVKYTTGSDWFGLWNPDNGNPISNTGTPGAGGSVPEEQYTPRNCYLHAKNLYNEAIKSVVNSEYTIGRRVYFWLQGCNENGYYTADEYEEAFTELHKAFVGEHTGEKAGYNFGATADTGASQAYPLEYGGILPVRSSLLCDTNATDKAESLKLTGPRVAQYDMARKNDNIFIVADAMERWSSNDNIKAWFEEKYEGQAYYGGAENMPYDWRSLMKDYVHYNQYALNELGIEAANNMLSHLRAEGTVGGIDIITPSGIEHIENGGTITLPEKDGDSLNGTVNGVIPVMPAESGLEGTFTLSGNTAAEFKNGMLIPKTALSTDFSTLKVSYRENGVDKTMEFRVETPFKEDTVEIAVAPIYDNYSAIYTLTTDDGWKASNVWLDTTLASIEDEKSLEDNTLKATMGLIVDRMGKTTGVMTWEEAQALTQTGRWDVANHTMAHKQTDFHNLTEAELEVEINDARAELKKQFPNEKILGLYTPGGKTSDLIRSIVAKEHLCLRHAGGGYNALPLTDKVVFAGETATGSLYTLKVAEVGSSSTAATAKAQIDSAIANNGWLVEMWHAVGDIGENSGAYSPVPKAVAEEHLAYIADKAKAGELWITTLDEACVYATQRLYTRLSLKSKTDSSMIIGVEDDLDNSIYDAVLTINVTLPSGWSGATVSQGGSVIASSVKDGKIIFNTLPDAGDITITKE